MRLTDERYTQQRFRLEVALRMIRHEARTSTIRESTGVSEDRIRKLHRTYLGSGAAGSSRRRGKSPQQTYCLTHNLQTRMDAALLTGILHATGVLDRLPKDSRAILDAAAAARICDVFELFEQVRPARDRREFTFEHAWFLVRALQAGTELAPALCSRCCGLTLKDIYSPHIAICPLCETRRLMDRRCRKELKKCARETKPKRIRSKIESVESS